jgi:hypothetical protein
MKKYMAICLISLSIATIKAQDFLDGNHTFSSSKESYLTLKNGTELVGYIDDIDRSKGLIKEITIKDSDGNKKIYLPDSIDHMYIAPSKWDKFSTGSKKMNDFSSWDKDKKLNAAHIKEGYALFESTEVMIKNEKKVLLLQLINPAYASKIRVYFDPRAKESASMGMGGLSLSGGEAKSYYVKKGTGVAFKLEKKNYEEEEKNLYGDCSNYMSVLTKEKELDWSDLSKHIYNYTEHCK